MDKKRLLKCSIFECNSTSDTHRLFRIPKNKDLRNSWLSFLVPYNPELLLLSEVALHHRRVCSRHFEKDFLMENGSRRHDAYPTLITPQEIQLGEPSLCPGHAHTDHSYAQLPCSENDSSDETMIIQKAGISIDHDYCVRKSTGVVPPSGAPDITSNVEDTVLMLLDQECVSTLNKTPKCVAKVRQQRMKAMAIVKKVKAISLSKNTFVNKINTARMMIEKKWFTENIKYLNKATRTFLNIQLSQVMKKKRGCRFSLDEKILALSLLKESPKCYRLLKKMFLLPSETTLRRLSNNLKLTTGLNQNLLDHLEYVVQDWDTTKKLCSIIFDEMQLSPHVAYNEAEDKIEGFVEKGFQNNVHFADHALVFMIRGICSSWRQPLAFYFVEGTVNAASLQRIIKEITNAVVAAGLIPLNYICDQGSTFRTALKEMLFQTRRLQASMGVQEDGTIEVGGCKINIMYDPPHLIKGIRNNLLTKDMVFEGKDASWRDIMTVHELNSLSGNTKLLPKLTDQHILPEKIKKMKVSYATQVLSSRMSALLEFTSHFKTLPDGKPVPETMMNSSKAVAFFDKLFDSANGSKSGMCRGKLRGACSKASGHSAFWELAKHKIKEIKFKDTRSKKAVKAKKTLFVRVPSLVGWEVTLESLQRLSKLLLNHYKVNYFYTRNLNQDPLENFFGRIRAINYRNTNPTASTFKNSFKSLMISQLITPSKNRNCEDDNGKMAIHAQLLFTKTAFDQHPNKENMISRTIEKREVQVIKKGSAIQERVEVQSSAYTAGYVCRKLSMKNSCKQCLLTYTTELITDVHKWISHREYKGLKNKNLTYPSEKMVIAYRDMVEYVHSYLNKNCTKTSIGHDMRKHFLHHYPISWLGCSLHKEKMRVYLINLVIRLHTHAWCYRINKILKGSVSEKYIKLMDNPQKAAFKKYIITRRKSRKNQ